MPPPTRRPCPTARATSTARGAPRSPSTSRGSRRASTSIALAPGSGQIKQWIKADRHQAGTALSDETEVCGIVLPDFAGSVLNETYGIRFPDSLFDDGYLQPFTANSALSKVTPGAMFSTTTTAVLMGISLMQPTVDPWPGVVTTSVDKDQDGKPGVTANVAGGPGYSNIPAEFPPLFQQLARASSVYPGHPSGLGRHRHGHRLRRHDRHREHIPPSPRRTAAPKPGIDSHVLGCAIADGEIARRRKPPSSTTRSRSSLPRASRHSSRSV